MYSVVCICICECVHISILAVESQEDVNCVLNLDSLVERNTRLGDHLIHGRLFVQLSIEVK